MYTNTKISRKQAPYIFGATCPGASWLWGELSGSQAHITGSNLFESGSDNLEILLSILWKNQASDSCIMGKSSSSSSSDDEFRHLPKHERKRLKKLKKQAKKHGHHMPHGMYPGAHGAPVGAYPGTYPAGGYPTGVARPPGTYPAGSYPVQGYPGAAPGYPGAAPGYPGAAPGYPGAVPGYPAGSTGYPPAPNPAYPAPVPGYGAPAGGFVAPGAPPAGSYPGGAYPGPGSAPAAGGFAAPGSVPPVNPSVPSQPGYPSGAPGQPGYPTGAPGQPGYPVGAPGQALAGQFGQMNLQGNMGMPRPTVRAAPSSSAEKDAEVIRNAMKGAGTDEQAIIGIISQRSNAQRVQIMNMFKTMYGKDLIKDLESELSGDFRETIMAMFKPTTYYDAWSLQQAISGLGTKESVLIEILCTRTNAEIKEINACYQQHYHRSLEKDIVDDTSGHFKRLLVSCCQANRAELTPDQWQRLQTQGPEAVIDRNLAREDANKLFQAGEKKLGTDESAFLSVLAIRNYFQMRATFEEYVKISGRDILSSIDREMSGDLKDGFMALVMSAKNRPEYFADKLYRAMKGAGTQDSTLIRIVVSRSEIDLQDIKEVYLSKYRKTLGTSISSDTSGDYKRLLLALVGQ
ncbi:annexin A7-like isoform X2 [Dreissena polymorpha]|uniref:annexin A7-like isoform X2 n=1 Tax=Dreissena polymorpha TaxID=45954 RepID=UPI0022642773|nr:annexin A7-like isoform X2 [Dreissena polymorpha]